MGYTHYFKLEKSLDQETIDKICQDTKKLLNEVSDIVCKECDEPEEKPEVDNELGYIAFNGKGHEGHETFYINLKNPKFNFCKTNYKPYDIAVLGTMFIFAEYAPDSFNLSSDGTVEEFTDAISLYENIFNRNPNLEVFSD